MNPVSGGSPVHSISFVDGPQSDPKAVEEVRVEDVRVEDVRIDETHDNHVPDDVKDNATSASTRTNTERKYSCGIFSADLASLTLGVGLVALSAIFFANSNNFTYPLYVAFGLVSIAPGYMLFCDSWNNIINNLIRRRQET